MSQVSYQMPDRLVGSDGQPRRVGVEIEMSGIELAMIAEQVVAELGGTVEAVSDYELQVKGTALGDFKVDLDFEYLQKLGRRDLASEHEWSQEFEHLAADRLQALMKNLIPCELIAPPLPFAEIERLDRVVKRLRDHGANGTREALLAAFGLHLNPELPDLEAGTILNYLRAFVCLRTWLEEQEDIAFSRKLSLFIRNYPADYENLVLSEDYQPSLPQLMDDYLEYNATRNRMLDLLPLLAHLDEDRVKAAIGGQKLRKRPTLHYRLPNSDINNPDWGVWRSWNAWMQVESLANDEERLGEVAEAMRSSREGGILSMNYYSWTTTVKQWLNDPT